MTAECTYKTLVSKWMEKEIQGQFQLNVIASITLIYWTLVCEMFGLEPFPRENRNRPKLVCS